MVNMWVDNSSASFFGFYTLNLSNNGWDVGIIAVYSADDGGDWTMMVIFLGSPSYRLSQMAL